MIYKEELKETLLSIVSVIFDNPKLKELNEEQKECIEKNFNTHINFEYIEDGGYIFIMNKDTFTRFEYYLGMEYDSEYIESKVVVEDTIMVTYSYDSSRAEELINTLGELSEE